MTNVLDEKTCVPCQGGMAAMDATIARDMMGQLQDGWVLDDAGTALRRRIEFKGFAKAVYHANLAAWLADTQGHHPDIRFGWGYFEIEFTTHEADGVTENDFICAAKFDDLLATA